MATRELDSSPRILPLYARALAPLLPGASRLPWIAGAGSEIPDAELRLSEVRPDPEHVAAYARVCKFSARGPSARGPSASGSSAGGSSARVSSASDELPATYPHLLAFPLHLALMTDGRFPLGAIGLVHVANRITRHRPIGLDERLDLRVRATPLEEHPRGQTFSIVSEARAADELLWEELSTMLHRAPRPDGTAARADAGEPQSLPGSLARVAEWQLPGDLGRRYAAVSGDRNPIHLHALSARAFGFPRAIAHGMWTKARCLAALQEPDGAFSIDVRFRRPILLPSTVGFASAAEGDLVSFAVRSIEGDSTHLEGRLGPSAQVGEQAGAVPR